MNTLKDLKKRVLELSYENELTHIGSCLDALPIIYDIYAQKRQDDIFVLSQGHAGLALYVILEEFYSRKNGFYGIDAQNLFNKHGTHPNRDLGQGIFCSTGSLGHGIGISVGMALANRKRDVYCLVSDGECAEGLVWESLELAYKLKLSNLKIYLNLNGYSAYDKVESERLINKLKAFGFPIKIYKSKQLDVPFLTGLEAHYHKMSIGDYQQAGEKLYEKA
jgi:transketolase